MKIEVGKSYRTRDGQKADVTHIGMLLLHYPVIAIIDGIKIDLTRSGCYYTDGLEHELDLIAPWEEEFNPKRGDWVMVWDFDESKSLKRIFLSEIKGAEHPIITVHKEDEDKFLKGKLFSFAMYRYMKTLPKYETVELTLQDISEGKGKGVPSHLIRIKK